MNLPPQLIVTRESAIVTISQIQQQCQPLDSQTPPSTKPMCQNKNKCKCQRCKGLFHSRIITDSEIDGLHYIVHNRILLWTYNFSFSLINKLAIFVCKYIHLPQKSWKHTLECFFVSQAYEFCRYIPTPPTPLSDCCLLNAARQLCTGRWPGLGTRFPSALQSLGKHYQAIVKQVPSIYQLLDICLIISCQRFVLLDKWLSSLWKESTNHISSGTPLIGSIKQMVIAWRS